MEDRSSASSVRIRVVLTTLLACMTVLSGCHSEHLMLARTPQEVNLGAFSMEPYSNPVFSPDGGSVIYEGISFAIPPPPFPVVAVNLSTQSSRTLFSVPAYSSLSSIDRINNTLLFSVPDSTGGGRHVAAYDLQGDSTSYQDNPAGSADAQASVSPDGGFMVFVRTQSGTSAVMKRDLHGSSNFRTLLPLNPGQTVAALSWTDDQHCLISTSGGRGVGNNFVVNMSGLQTDRTSLGYGAVVDPTGRFAASLFTDATTSDIWLGHLSRNDMKTQLTDSQFDKTRLSWSGGGEAIVYRLAVPSKPANMLGVLILPPLQ